MATIRQVKDLLHPSRPHLNTAVMDFLVEWVDSIPTLGKPSMELKRAVKTYQTLVTDPTVPPNIKKRSRQRILLKITAYEVEAKVVLEQLKQIL